MTLSTLVAFAAEESEHHGNVALETIGYFFVALLVFAVLGFVAWSYRGVANRHPQKAQAYAATHVKELQKPEHGH
ncbi:heme/copper-type cytochrome/quinol oxidase subunit 2 [Microbacterium halimionae]|uniref:Heme/copper-type cytochrome/quinol oxidase subunit 2 n=1 Tax=Microbacterium halimionae TaxID=1526413 RepID=A0A7W3JNA6_9MICO|nr:hypothetical protein [Microbacterium halimionae]MBA8815987.1 heme/copper-type cytochrome/quinol oxidase subunit 2 [Microbacterium halimionae]NII96190.1 heme/copper-type cytochrome/quinol oxidase subunit 2 [Microbacterium halimionae]